MNPQQVPHPIPINLELPADLEAIYANFAVITHSPSEVIVDFARVLPGPPKSRVHARIVMTPMNAKALLKALGENLDAFEKQHGVIKLPEQPQAGEKTLGFAR